MKKSWKNWKYWISPVLLALVLLAGIWYARPVDICTLYPDLEPVKISVVITRFHGDAPSSTVSYELDAGEDDIIMVLSRLESLRFSRPPTNLLLQLLTPTGAGRATEEGDYNYVIDLFNRDGGYLALQFFIDEWKYSTPGLARYLLISGGEDAGRSLGDLLWELSPSDESDP